MKIKVTEKRERSLGTKLFIKAERCLSAKCATIRRPYKPGMHGKSRRRPSVSEFSQQLQEKQKIRFSYGLTESQLKKISQKAIKSPGLTGQMIFSFLERRLDNVVYRLGIAPSRAVARQLVGHGHLLVNGRKVTIPSYEVKVNDVIAIRPQSNGHPIFKELPTTLKKYEPPIWLDLNKEKIEGKIISLPKDLEMLFDVGLVVDYYSK